MIKTLTRFTILLLMLCLALPMAVPAAQAADTLVVASTTAMSGEFMAGMWGNNTVDVDIRILLHDYPTVVWGLDEEAIINKMAVSRFTTRKTPDGDTEYIITLNNNLRFSDGSAITAKDYVFSLLLEASPLIRELGGSNVKPEYLLGADAYTSGEAAHFSGVRLLDNLRFSLTVSQAYLPYYYDLTFVHVLPYPAAVIAPGCEVKDDGQGAYVEGLTAEILQASLLDPVTGYVSHPGVTSGAYKLVAFDPAAKTAEFEANPYFLGNRDKKKPAIKRLLVREIKNDEIAIALEGGEVQLVNKISAADIIDAVRALPADQVKTQAYPRNGFGYLTFSVEGELLSSFNLRAAVTRMVNRELVAQSFLREYGMPVYAYYGGKGQWMPRDLGEGLKQFDKHPFDLAAAEALLVEDGWIKNSEGGEYDKAAGGLRHKAFGEELRPLVLKLALPPDNQAGEIALANLKEGLSQLGGEVEVTYLPMMELLRQYYRQDERVHDMLFLASNFGYVFDPYYSYQTEDAFQGTQNTSGLKDEELLALATTLRQTTPGDKAAFLTNWVAFQQRWTDLLPMLPLYSNTYYDGFAAGLTNYHPERHFSWADAILYAQFK